jgi:hypothetical protein
MSNRQLMAALRRTKPEKSGDLAPSAPASTTDTDRQEERADRALEEVMAAGGCPIGPKHDSAETRRIDVKKLFCDAVGISHEPIAGQLVAQIGTAMHHKAFGCVSEKITGALAIMQELKPTGIQQALLACQIIGVHHAAMEFLHRSSLHGQTVEAIDSNVNRATRLMRLFTVQLEALAKLRGQAEQQPAVPQRAAVEQHVTVQDGGQAIVSAVVTADSGAGGKSQ